MLFLQLDGLLHLFRNILKNLGVMRFHMVSFFNANSMDVIVFLEMNWFKFKVRHV